MQGAARSQWLFHWEASQRSRRRSDAQSEGPDVLLATKSPELNRKIQNPSPNVDQSGEPKGLDRLVNGGNGKRGASGVMLMELAPVGWFFFGGKNCHRSRS